MSNIRVTEIYHQENGPVSGRCLRSKQKFYFERDAKLKTYSGYKLNDNEWEMVETQPDSKDDFHALDALHQEVLARGAKFTFKRNDADWPQKQG